MAELKDIQFFGVTSLSTALVPNSIYFVLRPNTTSFELYITDLSGIPVPISDSTTTGSVLSVTGTGVSGTISNPKVNISTFVSSQLNNQVYLSLSDGKLQVNPITSPDNSIEVTSTSLELQIQLSAAIQNQINSALQSGANISELTNDAGYLTIGDLNGTDLSYTPSATSGIVNSSTGADATIPLAGALNAGLLSPSEKLDIASAVQPSDLATVATTGEYSDLLNLPQTKTEFNSELTDGDFLFVGDITQYTDELAQDAVGGVLTDTDTIDLIYNDGSNTISAEVKANSIDASHLADNINISEFVNDEGFESAAQLNVRDANNRNRANHTGIQLSSTIVDFDIAATAAVVENSITDGVTNKAPSENAVYDALDLKTTLSAGAFSGFAVTNNGDGTISVGLGIAYLRATNDQYAPLIKYPIAAYNNIPLVDNLNNYIVVSYNGGSPALVLNTTGTGIDTQTSSIAIAAARVGTTVHYVSLVGSNSDPNAKLRNRYLQSEGIRRVAGLAISATGRKIATTAGITYSGLIRLDVAAMNTNVSDTYTLAYNNGSTWTRVTGQTDINNTQYNNAGTLTALSNNNFRTDYIYALVNSPSKLFVILGNTQYNTIGAARLAPTPSSLPVELQQLGVLVGRAIIEKDAVIMEVASPFTQDFAAGAIENHNDLAGLQGGTAGEYNHLTDTQVALVDGSEQTSNKSDSYTVSSTTTYPNTKALVDGLDLKANLSGGNSFIGNQNFAQNSKIKIGLNTSYGKISVADNTTFMDSHSLDFYDKITSSVTGQGYGVVDVSSVLDGTTNNDHFIAYQARPFYIGSGAISGNFGFTGFHYQPTHTGLGTITNARGMRIMGILGAGEVINDIGLEIDDRSRGSVSNIAIKTGFGKVIFGDEMTVAGNSSFAKQLLVNGSTAGDAQLAVTNTSATGYGTYLRGGNTADFALRIDNYSGAQILEAYQDRVDSFVPIYAPTAAAGTNNLQIANTAFVNNLVSSGTYTPTFTPISNVVSLTLINATYSKIGNIVTATIGFDIETTSVTGVAYFKVTLPINKTTFSSINIGSGSTSDATGNDVSSIFVQSSDVDAATCSFNNSNLTSTPQRVCSITFQYSIN
ncbi:MAG TPA: hypothetical protein VLA48_03305 [Nitrososphaeraceae archaeon]|nr:hypothetical protein [Nitrososphaeraceae archaeon]